MTEPEQWAVEWHKVALIAQDHEDPCLNTALGSLYDAFEERERKLREEMAVVQQSHKWVYTQMQRLESALKDIASRAHANLAQALKDTTHD